jgi:hypothetical protein
MQIDCLTCQNLAKREFLPQVLRKFSNIKYFKIYSVRSELFDADGRMDGQPLPT